MSRQYIVAVWIPPRFVNLYGPFKSEEVGRNFARGLRARKEYAEFKAKGGVIATRPLFSPFEEAS